MFATPTILAIDLGKFNSVFCWFDPATKATTFRTVPSNPEAIRDALLRQPGVTAIMEAVYHLWRKQVAFDAEKFLAS